MGLIPEITNLAEAARYHRDRRPDKTAMIFGERQTTYRELDERANRVANGLLALGLPDAARVAVLTANSDFFFELHYGAAKANLVLCPVNWRLAPPELQFILDDAEVEILFVEPAFLPGIEAIRAALPRLRHIIVLGDGADTYRGWRDKQSDVDPMLPTDHDAVLFQMYTSGTTGRPKGVQITHADINAMRRIEADVGEEWARWSEGDVAIVSLPNFHISGNMWGLIWLYHGGTIVIHHQVDPRAMLEAIPRYGVTQMFAVPALLKMMLEDEAAARTDFSTLKTIYYGGSPISPAVLRSALAVFRCGFLQMYGMTETSGVVCNLPPHEHDLGRPELLKSCGKPYPHVRLKVCDEQGNELPPGKVGEICILTPALMKGYWKLPDATRAALRDGWYRSGDAGYRDEQGYFYLVDRIKDMIVTGGENVYPIEVENALHEHPAVADVAVIGVPDEKWGEAVKAVVVARPPGASETELISFLRGRIAGYKIPKSVDFADALPRNPAGKILKREIRKPYWEKEGRQVG